MAIMQGKQFQSKQENVELSIVQLLRVGSVIAAALIAMGLALLLLGGSSTAGSTLVTTGLIVLVVTPALRVVTAFVVFLRDRDYTFALISGVVLFTLTVGVILGKMH